MKTDEEWRRDFYDEDYALLYRDASRPERSDAEVEALVKLLHLPAGARVLDLCCGQGRHATRLAGRGLRVVGLDYSRALLGLARRATKNSGPSGAAPGSVESFEGRPALVQADARALPLRASFDALICLYNSLSFAGDQTAAVLREVAACLVDGGQLVVECEHRDQVARMENGREWLDLGEARLLADRRFDPVTGIASSRMLLLRTRKDGTVDEREKRLRFRAFSATEWKEMVESAGLTVMGIYGEYDRRPFACNSPLLLLHARKGYSVL